jgi:hypothetical protein
MLKPTLISASALALFAIASSGYAQAPFANVTPDMIRTSLPLEGAPQAEKGAYAVTSEPTFGAPGHVIVRPANLDAFPKKDTLPVIAWGNGGCAIDSKSFMGFMETVASHGFLVIGTSPIEGAPRRQANVDDLRAALDWADKENRRDGSPLKGKIAVNKMAAMGSSCGGFLSIEVGADPRVKTIGVFNSGVIKLDPKNPPPFPIPDVATLAKMATAEPHGPAYVRHFVFNHVIERSRGGATGKAYVAVVDIEPRQQGSDHSISVIGRYDDEYVKTAQGWRLRSRVLTAVGGRAPPTASR